MKNKIQSKNLNFVSISSLISLKENVDLISETISNHITKSNTKNINKKITNQIMVK